jgi:hypothetical protein
MKSNYMKVQVVLLVLGMLGMLLAQLNEVISMNPKLLTALLIFGLMRILQLCSLDRGSDFIEEQF